MKKWIKAIFLTMFITFFNIGLSGCGGTHTDQSQGRVHQLGGGLLGGVTGGIIGSHIGKGSGNVAAIIGGTLAGAALGSYVGGYMDRVDQQQMAHTLETKPTGQTSTWQNPDTGNRYQITPVRTFKTAEGRYCREFNTQVNIGGEMKDAYGTACRMPDGSWQIQGSEPEIAPGEPHYVEHPPIYTEIPKQSPSWKIPRGYTSKPKIPKGHLPPPGMCRIWHPGTPPGLQPPPGNCAALSRQVPPGAWLITR